MSKCTDGEFQRQNETGLLTPSVQGSKVAYNFAKSSRLHIHIRDNRCATSGVKYPGLHKKQNAYLTIVSAFSFTGLPKAAAIGHSKLWFMSTFLYQAGMNSDDVLYTCLPLYHSAGFIGLTSTIERGRHIFDEEVFWQHHWSTALINIFN